MNNPQRGSRLREDRHAGRGRIKTCSATGRLRLHGQTRAVTFPVRTELTPGAIEVGGSIPVPFSKWSIPDPRSPGS